MEELPSCLHWVKNKNKEINGVQVDIYLNTKRHRKNFNFANNGGKEEALLQAIEYRDTFCAENDIELKPKKEPTSDIVGVSRTEYYDITDGNKVLKAKWQAVWQTEPGKQKTARFSVLSTEKKKLKPLLSRQGNMPSQHLKVVVTQYLKVLNIKLQNFGGTWILQSLFQCLKILVFTLLKQIRSAILLKDHIQGEMKKTESLYIAGKKNLQKKLILW